MSMISWDGTLVARSLRRVRVTGERIELSGRGRHGATFERGVAPRLRTRLVRSLRRFVTTPPVVVSSSSRVLYVVARDRPDLYEALREKFLESARLAIVLDRRGNAAPPGIVRDERRVLAVEEALRTRGWARVRIDPDGRAAIA